jgi:hypothetical protein
MGSKNLNLDRQILSLGTVEGEGYSHPHTRIKKQVVVVVNLNFHRHIHHMGFNILTRTASPQEVLDKAGVVVVVVAS